MSAEPDDTAAAEPAPDVAAPRTYEAVRRGGAGWVAAVLAVACVAAFVRLTVQGDLGAEILLAAGLVVGAVLASLFAYRRIGRSSRIHLDRDGILTLVFGPTRHVVDLARSADELEVRGRPGDRDWQILIRRRGQPSLPITSASVDPRMFTEALQQWRPDV